MEASYFSLQYFRLDIMQVAVIGLLLFVLGFWLGKLKSKKMHKQMAKMEKKIMDLNTELLYGPNGPQVR